MNLTQLLDDLSTAVRLGDKPRALELARQIQQWLATEAADHAAVERLVRALLAQLEATRSEKISMKISIKDVIGIEESFDPRAERSDSAGETDVRPPHTSIDAIDQFSKGLAAGQLDIPSIEGRDQPSKSRPVGEADVRPPLSSIDAMDQISKGFAAGKLDIPSIEGRYHPSKSGPAGEADALLYPVWFGTNRRPNANGSGFTGERHTHTTLGQVIVRVPEAHQLGELGSSWLTKLMRFDFRDDHLRLHSLQVQSATDFFASMKEAMSSEETPHALIFLHGFNVSFEEAAIQAAQLGVDLKVPGATAFFSWPSRGSVIAYPADEASIESSERAITEFLVDFAARSGAAKIHVIAHSMGNRGLLRALQRIAANAETRGKVKFGQIFLAAPDVDRDLFLDLAHLYPEHSERTTLYASDGDLPVHLSSKLHDAPRAGYFAPYTIAAGIDTIAVPDFDLDLLGHNYIAQAEALLHDLNSLICHGEAPSRRQRIRPATHAGQSFWKLLK